MNITWDAHEYKNSFGFVADYGVSVMELLTAPQGSLVVDLGCGNGRLTRVLADRGYHVIGVDDSAEMIELARREQPDLTFVRANALDFSFADVAQSRSDVAARQHEVATEAEHKQADAIFSNAMLHWVDADLQPRMLTNIASQLRTGGEFVFECGGIGCAARVHGALEQAFSRRGLSYAIPQYLPSIGAYAPLLEDAGFLVTHAFCFDRPTPQVGADGLRRWILMFNTAPFEGLDDSCANAIIDETVESLRREMCVEGVWYVDYVRLRMRAVKCVR